MANEDCVKREELQRFIQSGFAREYNADVREFLYDKLQYTEAKKYLELAMQSTSRQDCPLADKSRQQEVVKILDKVNKNIRH